MEFRLLGPLEVVDRGRTVPLGGRKQRVVLARLLLRANQAVPIGALIDQVWGDDPPAAARNSLQTYVSHLRKSLGNDRIGSGPGGYTLAALPDEIDVKRFEVLVERAGVEMGTDPAVAAETYSRGARDVARPGAGRPCRRASPRGRDRQARGTSTVGCRAEGGRRDCSRRTPHRHRRTGSTDCSSSVARAAVAAAHAGALPIGPPGRRVGGVWAG